MNKPCPTKRKTRGTCVLLLWLASLCVPCDQACAASAPEPIALARFDSLHRMIRAQPEEQKFWRIPWTLILTDARRSAAAQGKPILIWAGAGGAPIGVC